jgi:hypothetical protein
MNAEKMNAGICVIGAITMKTEKTAERPYNYTNNNYFLNNKKEERKNNDNNSLYPNFTLQISIDYFTLSINGNADQYTLRDILTSIGFKPIRKDRLDKGNYQMHWNFKNPDNGITVEVFYASKKICFPSLLLKINDPDKVMVTQLHEIFFKNKITVKLSFVELTFDFYTDNVIRLREFLKSFTFMRNSRSKPGKKKTTFYLNNIRKSVRGMRIYTRPEWKKVRMEVTLKSQILKRLGLSFPFDSIDSLDVARFFSFKLINRESFQNYLIWSNRKLIEEIDQKRPGFGNLVVCQIHSWINSIVLDDYGRTTPMMEQIALLKFNKAIPNYSRFLFQLDDFSSEFLSQISGQKFLH